MLSMDKGNYVRKSKMLRLKEEIKAAFFEGYDSYLTQAAAYNNVETAWENSVSKSVYDSID